MPNLGWPEILLILIVVVLLFGAKKLPEAARSLGRSMRIFKSEVKEMRNDEEQPEQAPRRQIEQARPQQGMPGGEQPAQRPAQQWDAQRGDVR